jgi:hypothetical protein
MASSPTVFGASALLMLPARFAILAVVGLAACAPSAEKIAAAQHAQCVEFGYTAGTDAYGQCRLTLMAMADLRRANEQAAWNAASASMSGAANSMSLWSLANRPAPTPGVQVLRSAPGTAGNPIYMKSCNSGGVSC